MLRIRQPAGVSMRRLFGRLFPHFLREGGLRIPRLTLDLGIILHALCIRQSPVRFLVRLRSTCLVFPGYGFRKLLRIPYACIVTGYSSCVSYGGFSCSRSFCKCPSRRRRSGGTRGSASSLCSCRSWHERTRGRWWRTGSSWLMSTPARPTSGTRSRTPPPGTV